MYANFEAALLILGGTDLEPVLERGGAFLRTKDKGGPVETEVEWQAGAPVRDAITKIEGLLVGFINDGQVLLKY